jgi:hypothetical protein
MDWLDYWWLESEPSDGKRFYVYALVDPRSPSFVRYIGVTANVQRRFAGHLSNPTNPRVGDWIESLRKDGVAPRILTLTDCYGARAANKLEAVYIDEYQRLQGGLLNGVFEIAKRRKGEFDFQARWWLKDLIRKARKESGVLSRIAVEAARKRKRRSPVRMSFDC